MIIFLILGLIVLILAVIIISFFLFIPFFFGAPYEPSRGKALKIIVRFANPKSKDKIVDIGSGDGEICISLAKECKSKKIEIYGYELNPFLVWISRRRIRKLNLDKKIKIYWKNFWKADLSGYNKIVMFQFKTIMKRLSKKLKKELNPKSIVISHWWKLPGWKIEKSSERVYLYKR